ncbi:THH1/TOM1/TOM3 domain-containing protein [Plasmodiophora brassicae]
MIWRAVSCVVLVPVIASIVVWDAGARTKVLRLNTPVVLGIRDERFLPIPPTRVVVAQTTTNDRDMSKAIVLLGQPLSRDLTAYESFLWMKRCHAAGCKALILHTSIDLAGVVAGLFQATMPEPVEIPVVEIGRIDGRTLLDHVASHPHDLISLTSDEPNLQLQMMSSWRVKSVLLVLMMLNVVALLMIARRLYQSYRASPPFKLDRSSKLCLVFLTIATLVQIIRGIYSTCIAFMQTSVYPVPLGVFLWLRHGGVPWIILAGLLLAFTTFRVHHRLMGWHRSWLTSYTFLTVVSVILFALDFGMTSIPLLLSNGLTSWTNYGKWVSFTVLLIISFTFLVFAVLLILTLRRITSAFDLQATSVRIDFLHSVLTRIVVCACVYSLLALTFRGHLIGYTLRWIMGGNAAYASDVLRCVGSLLKPVAVMSTVMALRPKPPGTAQSGAARSDPDRTKPHILADTFLLNVSESGHSRTASQVMQRFEIVRNQPSSTST